jgi:quercetin dioxygenase-like cupin family protein
MSSEVIATDEFIERPVRHYNPVQKDYATFLRSASEPGSGVTLVEVEVHPGGGTSPHYHLSYAEHFHVLSGTLTVGVANRTYTLEAGDAAVAPINTLHYFRNNTTENVTFLVELRPGSVGFENAIKAGYGLARDGKCFSDGTPRNPLHLALLLDWAEIRLDGLLKYFTPLFRMLARRARRKGVERMLMEKYCAERS